MYTLLSGGFQYEDISSLNETASLLNSGLWPERELRESGVDKQDGAYMS
jgi:hypothetical protein